MTDWTAVCLATDLPPGVVIAAACEGAEIAVWRSVSGQLCAWRDRCPHRGMRLSHGFVRGETLSCIYHGWTYGADGGCKRIPAHPALVPPAVIRADSFECVQADGLVWVAPKGTQTAAPALSGLLPVRTLVVETTAEALKAALPDFTPDPAPLWRGRFEGGLINLLVQPMAGGRVRVTVLLPDITQAIAASRWIEAVRMQAEPGVAG